MSYATIPAVSLGLQLLEDIGLDLIHRRVACVTGWLLEQLLALRHGNGPPLVTLYGPPPGDGRGGTLAMNLCDAGGQAVDHEEVERRAAERGISLRTGCFCNPGAGETALGLAPGEVAVCLDRADQTMTYGDFRRCIDTKSSGAVRISLGLASTFDDVYRFVRFAEHFLD